MKLIAIILSLAATALAQPPESDDVRRMRYLCQDILRHNHLDTQSCAMAPANLLQQIADSAALAAQQGDMLRDDLLRASVCIVMMAVNNIPKPSAAQCGMAPYSKEYTTITQFMALFSPMLAKPAPETSQPPASAAPTAPEPAIGGDTVWFHSALSVGSINKEIDPIEYWGEIHIENTGTRPETVTLVARRYDGHSFLAEDYTIAPGGTRLIRVEDPDMDIVSADGSANESLLTVRFAATVLIAPLRPTLSIRMQQMDLHGDKLVTVDLNNGTTEKLATSARFKPPKGATCRLANISGAPQTALYCGGSSEAGCGGSSTRTAVPPFTTLIVPLSNEYMFFTKPREVIAQCIQGVEGITSTFNVNSGISFGAPVEDKKKDK